MTEDHEKLREYFAAQSDISFAYLFGSRAKGTARSDSDWDVAVWLNTDDPYDRLTRRLDLQSELSRSLGGEVDVVDLRSATPLLWNEVIQARGLLWSGNPLRQAQWELRAIGEYLDWLPYHRRYASALLARLTKKAGEGNDQPGVGGDSPWNVNPVRG